MACVCAATWPVHRAPVSAPGDRARSAHSPSRPTQRPGTPTPPMPLGPVLGITTCGRILDGTNLVFGSYLSHGAPATNSSFRDRRKRVWRAHAVLSSQATLGLRPGLSREQATSGLGGGAKNRKSRPTCGTEAVVWSRLFTRGQRRLAARPWIRSMPAVSPRQGGRIPMTRPRLFQRTAFHLVHNVTTFAATGFLPPGSQPRVKE